MIRKVILRFHRDTHDKKSNPKVSQRYTKWCLVSSLENNFNLLLEAMFFSLIPTDILPELEMLLILTCLSLLRTCVIRYIWYSYHRFACYHRSFCSGWSRWCCSGWSPSSYFSRRRRGMG